MTDACERTCWEPPVVCTHQSWACQALCVSPLLPLAHLQPSWWPLLWDLPQDQMPLSVARFPGLLASPHFQTVAVARLLPFPAGLLCFLGLPLRPTVPHYLSSLSPSPGPSPKGQIRGHSGGLVSIPRLPAGLVRALSCSVRAPGFWGMRTVVGGALLHLRSDATPCAPACCPCGASLAPLQGPGPVVSEGCGWSSRSWGVRRRPS